MEFNGECMDSVLQPPNSVILLPFLFLLFQVGIRCSVNNKGRAPAKGTQIITKKWLLHRRILFLVRFYSSDLYYEARLDLRKFTKKSPCSLTLFCVPFRNIIAETLKVSKEFLILPLLLTSIYKSL